MKTALIFARMDSRRLPGKAMADISGKPMLVRVLDRVARARNVAEIVLATSNRQIDDPIAETGREFGVAIFRGDAHDVSGRALTCCESRRLDAFVRISGDSPFVAAEIIDGVVDLYEREMPDLATNVYPRTFPPGCSAEVISARALERAHQGMTAADREHVTSGLYRQSTAYRILNLAAANDDSDVRLTVDDADEMARARWITSKLGSEPEAALLDRIVALAREYAAGRVIAQA